MEEFVKGDIVVIPFPFSDLTSVKKRPALVIASVDDQDVILCQVTSKSKKDQYCVDLYPRDFSQGRLPLKSSIRVSKIFTADRYLISSRAGKISGQKISEVSNILDTIFH